MAATNDDEDCCCEHEEHHHHQHQHLHTSEGKQQQQQQLQLPTLDPAEEASAIEKTNRANNICKNLDINIIFKPQIVTQAKSDGGRESIVVEVVYQNNNNFGVYWPYEKFELRSFDMEQVWEEWKDQQQTNEAGEPNKESSTAFNLETALKNKNISENPFLDSEYQLIAQSSKAYLNCLANMEGGSIDPRLRSLFFADRGKLSISLVPMDQNGGEGPWDEEGDELDPFVNDTSELVGKNIKFAVKLHSLELNEDIRASYKDVWIRYATFRYEKENSEPKILNEFMDWSETNTKHYFVDTDEKQIPEEVIEMEACKVFDFENVTAEFAENLQEGFIVFQVFGKVALDLKL